MSDNKLQMLEDDVSDEGCKQTSLPTKTKYPALALLCVIYFLVMVNYEEPASLQTVIMSDLSYSTVKFSLLMSANTWPSALSFLGGLMADRYLGIDRGMLTLVVVFCLGCLLYSVGMYTLNFSTIIAGRIFSGWAGEAIGAVVSSYIVAWFSAGGMSTAFAISCSTSFLGPVFIYQTSTPLYLAMVRNTSSLRDKQIILGHVSAIIMSLSLLLVVCAVIVVLLHIRSLQLNETESKPRPLSDAWCGLGDVLRLPLNFWVLVVCSAAVQTASYSFISMAQEFFVTYYKLGLEEANNIVSYSNLSIAVGSPLIGLLIDKTGRKLYYLMFSNVLAVLAHFAMIYTSLHPLLPVIILAVSSCLFQASYYSLIADIVNEHQLGTAYGISASLSNTGSGTGFMVVGVMAESTGGQSRQYFFVCLFMGALILSLISHYLDIKGKNESKKSLGPDYSSTCIEERS